jgi:hypothetical protein
VRPLNDHRTQEKRLGIGRESSAVPWRRCVHGDAR